MRQTLTRFVLAGVVAAGTAAAAPAFYWVGWPGANPVAPPSIVPQAVRVDYREPTPTTVTPPGGEPPGGPGDPPDEPKPIPEPATLTVAAVGLAGAAGWWWKKRKKK
jgi:LPXTG-motif cell wall-anchored protein